MNENAIDDDLLFFGTLVNFTIYQYMNNIMFLVDKAQLKSCDIVKQCIINYSGCYSTAQLYINLPIRLSYIKVCQLHLLLSLKITKRSKSGVHRLLSRHPDICFV